jgi:hypothetical protein
VRRQAETWAGVFLCALFTSVVLTTSTSAMPMFARKYNVPCSTCHTTAPRLNETGYRFRAAGFRMPEEIGRTSGEPFDILDYFSGRFQFRTGATRTKVGPLTTTNQQTLVQAMELYPLTGSWGKYFSSNIKITFAPVSSPAVAIENLYGKVNSGTERRFFSVRAGVFHPYDGYGASDSPATISRPLFQTIPANLDQSTFFVTWGFDESGAEVGFDSGHTSIRAAVLSGAVVSQEGGRFSATAGPLAKPSAGPTYNAPDFQLFVNHVLNPKGGGLSFQYYHGNLSLPITGTQNFFRNNFDRAAIYASYPVRKRLHLFGAYQYGRDHAFNKATFSSAGTFVEAAVPIKGMTAAGVRYDWFDPARPKANNEISGITTYVNAWFFSQLRIVAQYQHLRTERELAPVQTDDAFQLRIIYIK